MEDNNMENTIVFEYDSPNISLDQTIVEIIESSLRNLQPSLFEDHNINETMTTFSTIADIILYNGSENYNRNVITKNDINKSLGSYTRIKNNDTLLLNNESCSICLSKYKLGEYKRELKCNHNFHKKCVDKWFKKDKQECPICRFNSFN